MPIRRVLPLAALTAALLASGLAHGAPASRAAPADPGWAGTYIGQVPTPTGHGGRMVLVLTEDGRYQLTHDGRSADEVFAAQSLGQIRWDDDARRTLALEGSAQRFRLTDGLAELLPRSGQRAATPPGRLQRQQRFTGPDGELLVDPASLHVGQPQPGWVSFSAIWNLPAPAPDGARSFIAQVDLYCAGQSYRLSDAHGFSQAYLRGQPLVTAPPGTAHATPGTLMGQVAQQHCAR